MDTERIVEMKARIEEIRRRMEAAAGRAGRRPEEISLVAVTKTHPAELVQSALDLGLRIFGESRIQEAIPKIDALAGRGAQWHLIGHLQRNKAAAAVGRFSLIHSVDSVRLIEALEREAAEKNLTQSILIEINVSGEANKFGAPPEEIPLLLETLARSSHLRAEGLMTIPPYDLDPETTRPHFARLRRLGEDLAGHPALHAHHLSMGMSGDYEVAIEEGATMVRIGSAIFGERE